jgi:hypothetical protein
MDSGSIAPSSQPPLFSTHQEPVDHDDDVPRPVSHGPSAAAAVVGHDFIRQDGHAGVARVIGARHHITMAREPIALEEVLVTQPAVAVREDEQRKASGTTRGFSDGHGSEAAVHLLNPAFEVFHESFGGFGMGAEEVEERRGLASDRVVARGIPNFRDERARAPRGRVIPRSIDDDDRAHSDGVGAGAHEPRRGRLSGGSCRFRLRAGLEAQQREECGA